MVHSIEASNYDEAITVSSNGKIIVPEKYCKKYGLHASKTAIIIGYGGVLAIFRSQ